MASIRLMLELDVPGRTADDLHDDDVQDELRDKVTDALVDAVGSPDCEVMDIAIEGEPAWHRTKRF